MGVGRKALQVGSASSALLSSLFLKQRIIVGCATTNVAMLVDMRLDILGWAGLAGSALHSCGLANLCLFLYTIFV